MPLKTEFGLFPLAYDEYYEEYTCAMRLDEDEMRRFLSRETASCPYYRFYDEYKSVHKQI